MDAEALTRPATGGGRRVAGSGGATAVEQLLARIAAHYDALPRQLKRVAEQLASARGNDVVIAISFTPYGRETQACVRDAQRRRAKTVVVADSRLAPLAREASAPFTVKEGSAFAFRSLTATLCLAQALFVALAYRLELNIEETKNRGDDDD